MKLDVQTLLTVVTLSYFTGALIMAALASAVRSVPKKTRFGWGLWAFCLLLSGLCALLISQRGVISDTWSIVVANALLTVGFGFRPNAIALLNNKRMPHLYLPVAGTIGWLALYSFSFFRDDMFLRVVYINGFCLIGILLCLWESWQLDRKQVSSWLLSGAFTLDAVVRVSLIGTHFQKQFPSLLASYETVPLQLCFMTLIVATIIKIVGITLSIFEMQRRQFQREAERDPLTGLYNQRAFVRHTQSKLTRLASAGTSYALVLIEIDKLKEIGARFGIPMQDACMKLLSRITGLTVPDSTIAGLDSNGQIALFLPRTDQTTAVSYVRRLSQTLVGESRSATGSQVSVTMSAGIFCGAAGTPIERALEIAGHCCRKAQSQGGNKIMTHSGSAEGQVTANAVEPPFALRPKAPGLNSQS